MKSPAVDVATVVEIEKFLRKKEGKFRVIAYSGRMIIGVCEFSHTSLTKAGKLPAALRRSVEAGLVKGDKTTVEPLREEWV